MAANDNDSGKTPSPQCKYCSFLHGSKEEEEEVEWKRGQVLNGLVCRGQEEEGKMSMEWEEVLLTKSNGCVITSSLITSQWSQILLLLR